VFWFWMSAPAWAGKDFYACEGTETTALEANGQTQLVFASEWNRTIWIDDDQQKAGIDGDFLLFVITAYGADRITASLMATSYVLDRKAGALTWQDSARGKTGTAQCRPTPPPPPASPPPPTKPPPHWVDTITVGEDHPDRSERFRQTEDMCRSEAVSAPQANQRASFLRCMEARGYHWQIE